MSGHLTSVPAGLVPALHLEDDELLTLGLDPWANRGWSGSELRALAAAADEGRRRAREEAERTVLARTRRSAVEPWMLPLVERHLDGDPHHSVLSKIAPLVASALACGAALVFDID